MTVVTFSMAYMLLSTHLWPMTKDQIAYFQRDYMLLKNPDES